MNLISRIKKLFSKEKIEPTPEPEIRPEELSEGFIILHVDSDDQIFIDCGWRDDQESIKRFASLLYEVNVGALMPEILQFLQDYTRKEGNYNDYLSILYTLNESMTKQTDSIKSKSDSIVVKPTDVMGNMLEKNNGFDEI